MTFRDGKTNRPVVAPEGVTLEMVSLGRTIQTIEPFLGTWFIEVAFDYKLSMRNGRTYYFGNETALTVTEAA